MAELSPTEAAAYVAQALKLSLAEAREILSDAPDSVVVEPLCQERGLSITWIDLEYDEQFQPRYRPKQLRAWVASLQRPGKSNAGAKGTFPVENFYEAYLEEGKARGGWRNQADVVTWLAEDCGCQLGESQLKKHASYLMTREKNKGRY